MNRDRLVEVSNLGVPRVTWQPGSNGSDLESWDARNLVAEFERRGGIVSAIGDDPAAFVEAVRRLVEAVTDYQSDHGCDCWEAPNGRTETCYRCTFATALAAPALAKVRGE